MMGFTKDKLQVSIFPSREAMGRQAALDVADCIRSHLAKKEAVNMIFAAAPSQLEFLTALTRDQSVDFSRINAFHMDDYVGLPADAPQAFGNFLHRHLFAQAAFRSVHLIDNQAKDIEAECARYTALLQEYPVDIVCMGIGENGHIAFNDPGLADFEDPKLVKVIELEERSRVQQVNDGCFAHLNQVPVRAVTLTIPALMKGNYLFCMVPARSKAQAAFDTIHAPVSTDCPSTILRQADHAILYLDSDSASLLRPPAAEV